ncbi:hypothetical protein M405DRAFT_768598 [Rhizopogon salebrosus TDB-379]|nr:hypothetical protein M405DRAFT_768598 [Rhizopogon salebrosus TDB-379]
MRTSATRRSPDSTSGPDVVTYRLNNQMIYVLPAQSFDQAILFARSAFESELTGVHNSRISFSLNVLANGKQTSMGISSVAWTAVVSHLERYEIIDVHVQPEIQVLCYLCRSLSEGGTDREQHPTVPTSPSASSLRSSPSQKSQQFSSSQRSSSTLSSLIPRRLFRQLRR